MGESDGSLMERIARGSTAAFGILYDRHVGALLGAAQASLGSAAAEDLVHDVFLEVWRRAAAYDAKRGSVRCWLRVKLRSRTVDRIRRRKLAPPNPPAPPTPHSGVATLHALEGWLDAIAVTRHLDLLPPRERTVIELRFGLGHTFADTARTLGIPMGTVKSRVAAGLRRLRCYVDDGGDRRRAPRRLATR